MIYTVTLNPALDKTVEIPSLTVDSVNRITTMRTDPGGKGVNVSKVIQKLGGESTATGILGGGAGKAAGAAGAVKAFYYRDTGQRGAELCMAFIRRYWHNQYGYDGRKTLPAVTEIDVKKYQQKILKIGEIICRQ